MTEACTWRNHYSCPNCALYWTDDWSCQCDDRCPDCDASVQPYDSEWIGIDEPHPGDEIRIIPDDGA
jgi:Transcription initiation factor IIE, alpha subunit